MLETTKVSVATSTAVCFQSTSASSSHRREVAPEVLQTLRAPEEGREVRQVNEQDVAGASALRRHPEEQVELLVARGRERVGPIRVDGLPRQHSDVPGVLPGQLVMGQVLVEAEIRHLLQEAALVEIGKSLDRHSFFGTRHHSGAQPPLVEHRDVEPLHESPCVLAETLLSRHEPVAVVAVLGLPLVHVLGEAHVVMRRDQEAGPLALEPLADRLDLAWLDSLVRRKMVEAEDHEGVGVGENALVDREAVAGLVNALVDRDRMTGLLADEVLEAERRAMEELERPGDPLKELRRAELRLLVGGPNHVPDFGDRREPILHLGGVTAGFPGVAPAPVDADPALSRRARPRNVILVVSATDARARHGISPSMRNCRAPPDTSAP